MIREIGRGGMGVVYEAEQVSLGRRVALKVPLAHVVGDPLALERFRREAKAAAQIRHTTILPAFEVGRHGETASRTRATSRPEGRPKGGRQAAPTALTNRNGDAHAAETTRSDLGGWRTARVAESLMAGRLEAVGPDSPMIAAMGGMLTTLLIATTLGSIVAASHFRASAFGESLANRQSQVDRRSADAARRQATDERDGSLRVSSGLSLEKGIALARRGRADQGQHWLLEALKSAPDDAREFRRTVRWNLGAWLGQV